jgi:hypothetical protein
MNGWMQRRRDYRSGLHVELGNQLDAVVTTFLQIVKSRRIIALSRIWKVNREGRSVRELGRVVSLHIDTWTEC